MATTAEKLTPTFTLMTATGFYKTGKGDNMEREFNQRLQDLKDTGKELFSISKLDTINNCLYAAYRTYKLGDRGDGNIYSIMGSKIHDVLEQIINGNATTDDLLPAMQSELDEADLCGYSFPSDAVRENWVNNMTNFTKTLENKLP